MAKGIPVSISHPVKTIRAGTSYVFSNRETIAVSLKTTVALKFPGCAWRLSSLSVTWSSAPTTSESLTLTRNPGGGSGFRPSVVLLSHNPSLTSTTSLVNIWESGGLEMQAGDEVTLAYTNTDARTVTSEISIEVIEVA